MEPLLVLDTRESDSSWVDSVWTSTSDGVTSMTSVACETWGLVFWERHGAVHAAVTGPETRTGTAPVPSDARFVGIQFAVGTTLRAARMPDLLDSGITLPDTVRRRFELPGGSWEIPSADDAEALVARLVRDGAVERDPLVTAVAGGARPDAHERTVERRFRRATGLTRNGVRRIRRARSAAEALAAGQDVAVVVAAHGFYDEPHLARDLRRYVGRTAGRLRSGTGGAIALDAFGRAATPDRSLTGRRRTPA
ncbi:helix-turn-helix domain-containing protein [Pseudonocardia sp. NPDC049635]|uniref:helix-turn-helix domain-containing protein n=1 Tax=Pseudonocardia sp. NPDC049635 TaxID=3155506 RepID=UPI0033C85EDF